MVEGTPSEQASRAVKPLKVIRAVSYTHLDVYKRQLPAYGIQGGKAYCTNLSGFQIGKINVGDADPFCQLVQRNFPVCHHPVKS